MRNFEMINEYLTEQRETKGEEELNKLDAKLKEKLDDLEQKGLFIP